MQLVILNDDPRTSPTNHVEADLWVVNLRNASRTRCSFCARATLPV